MLLKATAFFIVSATVTFIALVLIGAFSEYQNEALQRGFEGAWERYQAARAGYAEARPWHEKRAADRNEQILPAFEE